PGRLEAEGEAGRVRRGLDARRDAVPVPLPPLRGRAGDVALLAQHFFHRYNAHAGKQLKGITPVALRCLERYPWPGNVRELKNELERAVALAEPGEAIDLVHLSTEVAGDATVAATAGGDE